MRRNTYSLGPPIARARRGFTLVELTLAATVTSVTALAGFTLVSAMSNATIQTSQIRVTKMTGQSTLARIARSIRSARAVGEVTATSMTLWVSDLNSNDAVELNETALIYYDTQQKAIYYKYSVASGSATSVNSTQFSSFATMNSLLSSASAPSVFWANNVNTFAFTGHPSGIIPQLVNVKFTITRGTQQSIYQATVSPRAQADYVFNASLAGTPPPGSTRKRRAQTRPWNVVTAGSANESGAAAADGGAVSPEGS